MLATAGACGTGSSAPSVGGILGSSLPVLRSSADDAVARAGCIRCHEDGDPQARTRAPRRGPPLADVANHYAADGGLQFLRAHHAEGEAEPIAAWLRGLAGPASAGEPEPLPPGGLARGERAFGQLACAACHPAGAFADLASRIDHRRLAAFLANPEVRRPGLVHVPVSAGEAADLAAWLLRAQLQVEAPQPGFAWTAWPQHIDDAGLPDFGSLHGATSGIARTIDTSPAPRRDHYVLRFAAMLDVPAAGEWTFTTASDDSSWLWLDGEQLVRNEGLAPVHERSAKRVWTAGPHRLEVAFTQAGGGAALAVRWCGPGVADEVVPASRAQSCREVLVPPPPLPPPSTELVLRGRAAARALRCDACHAVAEREYSRLPEPACGPPFAQLRGNACARSPAAAAVLATWRGSTASSTAVRQSLADAMRRDGCLSCHARDGQGGLEAAARERLAEVEDLGDEGRCPPDLTAVGRRLRPAWLEKVLRDGHSVRPYLRVRMPKLGEARAREYASAFAAADGAAPTEEPPFSLAAVQRGRELAGVTGRNCITCHTFQGNPALGPQGMDLAIQFERLQPGWFREWLLHPLQLRPGTRMPTLWWREDDTARSEVDALRCWLSLGAAAPIPAGLKAAPGSHALVASDRPRLHGAFLQDVSARCLAVATPERVHFAWDLVRPRLVWVWRGDFLDVSGTWSGRAGRLLRPPGTDWRVLEDAVIQDGASRRLLGRRLTADGYPVLRIAVGDTEYEDEARARLSEHGGEVVRTFRVLRGVLTVEFAAAPAGLQIRAGDGAAGRHRIQADSSLEVVYRW